MKPETRELLMGYIGTNVAPILISDDYFNMFLNAVVLPANCTNSELLGYYENERFIVPVWYNDLVNDNKEIRKLLIIRNLSSISKDEQLKFYELLKYRKIGMAPLPDNCVIILTSQIISKEAINEKIYSLVACVSD